MSATQRPHLIDLLTSWQPEPLAIVMVVVLAAAYLLGVRRLAARGVRWPVGRAVTFGCGVLLLAWTTNGVANVYRDALFWVWVTQTLILWLAVPLLLLGGGAVHLALAVGGPTSRMARVMASRPIRILSNPLIAPALVPILSAVLFFGPLPAWAITVPLVGWLLHVALVSVGAVMVLPLVGPEEDVPSLKVGISLAVGMIELVLDAVPGIVLRLHHSLVTSYFDHRVQHAWTPAALNDQRVAGSIVWVIAEVIDLPFLLVVFRRWARADARDAARIDAVLDAERIARGELETDDDGELGPSDRPWWESDADMRRRLGPGRP